MKSDTLISTGSGLIGGMVSIGQDEAFLRSCIYSAIFAAIGYMTKLGIDALRKKFSGKRKIVKSKRNTIRNKKGK